MFLEKLFADNNNIDNLCEYDILSSDIIKIK